MSKKGGEVDAQRIPERLSKTEAKFKVPARLRVVKGGWGRSTIRVERQHIQVA